MDDATAADFASSASGCGAGCDDRMSMSSPMMDEGGDSSDWRTPALGDTNVNNNGMSADETRQLINSLADQLEPNPLDLSAAVGTASCSYGDAQNRNRNTSVGRVGQQQCQSQEEAYHISLNLADQQQRQQQQQQQQQAPYPYGASALSASTTNTVAALPVPNGSNQSGVGNASDQNVAAFTEQDEKDELATLTIQEILDAEQDVRGPLSEALGNLSVGAAATTPAPSSVSASAPHLQQRQQLSIEDTSALLLLRAELLRISPHQKRSYTDAVQRCPDQVDQQIQLAYLRRDGYDAHSAAGRIVQYWENRLTVFGRDRCYLPMTLDGAARGEFDDMRAEALPYSTTVLPVRDANGRAVVYVKASPSGRTDAVGMEKMMRAFWYVLDTAASSSDGRQNGFVVIVNGTDIQRRHFSVKVFRLIRQLLWDILPTKAKCTHLCHPSKVNYYIVQPLVRTVFGKELRLRQRVHYGTTEKVLGELRQYALPPEIMPQDMGGQLQLNFEERILETALAERREFIQSTSIPTDVLSASMPVAPPSVSPMDTSSTDITISNKREHSHSDSFQGPSAARSSKSSTSGRKRRSGNATEKPPQKMNNRKGRSGRKSDPRMQRAVQIKLDNPDTALKVALQMGGFRFHPKNPNGGQSDKYLVDENGTSLSQHKNNLCRRLRQEKASTAGKSNNSQDSAGSAGVSGSSTLISATEDDAAFASAAAFSTGPVGTPVSIASDEAAATVLPLSSGNLARPSRRDSFDEAIAEIPQIEVNGTY